MPNQHKMYRQAREKIEARDKLRLEIYLLALQLISTAILIAISLRA
jgi:hypothetical protein